MEENLESGELESLKQKLTTDLNELVSKIKLEQSISRKITINSLIIMTVHSKDIVQHLVDNKEFTL